MRNGEELGLLSAEDHGFSRTLGFQLSHPYRKVPRIRSRRGASPNVLKAMQCEQARPLPHVRIKNWCGKTIALIGIQRDTER